MKQLILVVGLLIIITPSTIYGAEVLFNNKTEIQTQEPLGYVHNKIVLKLCPSVIPGLDKRAFAIGKTGNLVMDELGEKLGVKKIKTQFPGAVKKNYKGKEINLAQWHTITFSRDVDINSVIERYKKLPNVIDAQPISLHRVYREPFEQFYYLQWHLNRIQAEAAWDIETGNSSIIVAVPDTGVRYFAKDLGGSNASYASPTNVDGNIWINWAEKNGIPDVDDDGNGYVDDWVGYDFVSFTDILYYPCIDDDCDTPDNDPRDYNGHGTHCAGSISAINNNGEAVASLAGGWGDGTLQPTANGVKVMSLRIGWSASLLGLIEVGIVEMDYAAQAIYYAARNGAKILTASWGSENTGGLGEAVDYFLAEGGIIFKAAGNDSSSTADYLAGRPDVIAVAATDPYDCLSFFSNYGSWVDISAPGEEIWSLVHIGEDPAVDYVMAMSGTSMASPLAAATAALIWSQHPGWTADQVKEQLLISADPIDNLTCNSPFAGQLGAGRINAFQAVQVTVPDPLTAEFSANPLSGTAPLTVQFTDLSTGPVQSWHWDFGDNSSSVEQNPVHVYALAGTYSVSLTVTGDEGSASEIKFNYINVSSCSDTDADGDGYIAFECGGDDCNDSDASVNPGACDIKGDSIDQDCDGRDRTTGKPCSGKVDDESPTKERLCDDGVDNDGDGLVDCWDKDCKRFCR